MPTSLRVHATTLQDAHRIVNDHASDIHGGDDHADVSKRRFTKYQVNGGDADRALHDLKAAGFKPSKNPAPRAQHHLTNGRTHVMFRHPEGRNEMHVVHVQHATINTSETDNMPLSARAQANLDALAAASNNSTMSAKAQANLDTLATSEENAAYGDYKGYHPHRALHDEAQSMLKARGHTANRSSERMSAPAGGKGMRIDHQVGSTATKLPRHEQHAEHMAATQELHKLVQKHGFQHTEGGTYHHPETGAKVHIHTPRVGKSGDSYQDHHDNHTNMSITHSLSKPKAKASSEDHEDHEPYGMESKGRPKKTTAETALFNKGPKFGKNWKDHEKIDDHKHHMKHAGKHLAEYNRATQKCNDARDAGRSEEANKFADLAERHLGWNRQHLSSARRIYHKSMASFDAEVASLTIEETAAAPKTVRGEPKHISPWDNRHLHAAPGANNSSSAIAKKVLPKTGTHTSNGEINSHHVSTPSSAEDAVHIHTKLHEAGFQPHGSVHKWKSAGVTHMHHTYRDASGHEARVHHSVSPSPKGDRHNVSVHILKHS